MDRSTKMATAEEEQSRWQGVKSFLIDRFRILDSYHPYIRRDTPLPSWSDADVQEFIASDPVHGPVKLRLRIEDPPRRKHMVYLGRAVLAGIMKPIGEVNFTVLIFSVVGGINASIFAYG